MPSHDLLNVYFYSREENDEMPGDWGADRPGYTRTGQISRREDTGDLRTFWLTSAGGSTAHWLLARNGWPRRVALARAIRNSKGPAAYVEPPLEAGPPLTGQPPATPQPQSVVMQPLPANGPTLASASLIDRTGDPAGRASFVEDENGNAVIHVEAIGLTDGLRGSHRHAVASCEPPPFTSAGGHVNPSGVHHGLLAEDGLHDGDLLNLEAIDDGRAFFRSSDRQGDAEPRTALAARRRRRRDRQPCQF